MRTEGKQKKNERSHEKKRLFVDERFVGVRRSEEFVEFFRQLGSDASHVREHAGASSHLLWMMFDLKATILSDNNKL